MLSNNYGVFYVVFIALSLGAAVYAAYNIILIVRVGENMLKTLKADEQ